MAANLNTKIKIYFYGDSHLAAHHNFPAVLDDKVSHSSIINSKFDVPSIKIFSLPGKSIDDPRFYDRLCSNLVDQESRSIHFFAVGGNSVRDGLKPAKNQSCLEIVSDLERHFLKLISVIKEHPQAILVLCSLIPSPPHEPRCVETFARSDQMLQQLANAGSRIRFLDLAVCQRRQPGAAKLEFFANKGRKKDLHLCQAGTEQVVQRMVSCLEHLNSNYFGTLI